MKNTDPKALVVKSNRLVEAAYRLTLTEQRVVLFSIVQARETQTGLFPDLPVTISASAFAKQFRLDEKSVYTQLREAMDTLYERSITIHDIDPATSLPRVTKTRWISTASYIDGAGNIQVIFAPKVIPYITRLEAEFTAYRIEKIGKMSSAHAIRLYELLVQYLVAGSRMMTVAWLREALQLGDTFQQMGSFKKFVLDVGVKQINELTDITVSYKPVKTGRAITGFRFKIKSNDSEKKKKIVVNEKNAHPGETFEAARKRLEKEAQAARKRQELEDAGQEKLPDL